MNIKERWMPNKCVGFNFTKHVWVSPSRNSNNLTSRQRTDFIHNRLLMTPYNLISTVLVQLRDQKLSPHDLLQIRVVRPKHPFNLSIPRKIGSQRNQRARERNISRTYMEPLCGGRWRILRWSLLPRHVDRHGLLGIFLFKGNGALLVLVVTFLVINVNQGWEGPNLISQDMAWRVK